MNSFDPKFTLKNQHALRRSYIGEPEPYQHQQISAYERPNILKRSSFTPNPTQSSYDPSTPIRPHITSAKDVMHSSPSIFYHKSNYYVNERQNTSGSKVSIEEKLDKISNSFKQNCKNIQFQEMINKMTVKLNKTASLVERHEKLLKTMDVQLGVNYWRNNIGLKHVIEENIADQMKYKERDWSIQNNLLKGQIQSIRKMFKNVPMKIEMKNEISSVQSAITDAITGVTKNLVEKISLMMKSQEKQKKQNSIAMENKLNQLKKELEEKTRFFYDGKKDQDTESSNNSSIAQSNQIILPSTRRNLMGDSIIMKLRTRFSVEINEKQTKIEECEDLYKIDEDGFLLDWQNKYIIDQGNRKIKLSYPQIQKLKTIGILKNKG